MYLSPQIGPDIEPVSVADLDRVFAEESFGEFLILGDGEHYFIETSQRHSGSDKYRIKWRNPGWDEARATLEILSVDQVKEAFVGYLLGRDWYSVYDWVPWEPVKVRIPCEPDYGRFPFCGQLHDGTLFMAFVTGEPTNQGRRWVAVIHLFDSDGNHMRSESRIGGHDRIGIDVACERADAELAQMVTPILQRIKQVGDVFIRPFHVLLNGVRHGLVYDDRYEAAIFHPRDVWFYFPWATGDYDT